MFEVVVLNEKKDIEVSLCKKLKSMASVEDYGADLMKNEPRASTMLVNALGQSATVDLEALRDRYFIEQHALLPVHWMRMSDDDKAYWRTHLARGEKIPACAY